MGCRSCRTSLRGRPAGSRTSTGPSAGASGHRRRTGGPCCGPSPSSARPLLTRPRVEARLGVAQRILTSGRHEVEAIDPQTEKQLDDLARVRHTVLGLHRALEEARVELQRTQASLHRSAAAARESAPEGRPVEVVHTDLLRRTLRAASTEGHRLDEVVSRVSSQAGATLRSAHLIGDAARERMKVRRGVGGGAAGLPAPGVDR